MDENKQIEEIKNILLASTPVIDMPFECFGAVAKAIYNAGYRKTDDVNDHLMNAETSSGLTEKEIEFFVKHNEKVRKETVREFVEKAKQFFYEHYGKYSDLPYKEYCEVNILCIDLDELAKEYGVEVEE